MMKYMRTILALVLFAICLPSNAQQVITATITITNAPNDGDTLTVNSDVRVWKTNATLASQIQIPSPFATGYAGTNLFDALILVPFSSTFTSQTASNVVTLRTPPSFAVTASASGAYCTITFFTNTLTSAVSVRVPYTVETAPTQTNVVNGLVDWLNLSAATHLVNPNAPAWANFLTLVSTNVSSNIVASLNYVTPLGAQISPASQLTNYWLDFGLTNQFGAVTYQSIATSANVNFIGVTNAVKEGPLLSVDVFATNGPVLVTMPTNWFPFSTNGLYLLGSFWALNLSNHSEFRITMKSNVVSLSTLWTVTGPSSVPAIGSGTNQFYPINGNPANYLIAPTNSRTDGYVVQATGGDSKWAANGLVGSGLNIWPNYSGSVLIFAVGGTASYGFDLSRAPSQKVQINATAPSGTAIFYLQNFQETASQYGVYYLTITCSGTNTQISWLDPSTGGTPYRATWMSQDGSITNAPSLIQTNQAIIVTLRHFGGQTNYAASYLIGTNLDHTTPVFAN